MLARPRLNCGNVKLWSLFLFFVSSSVVLVLVILLDVSGDVSKPACRWIKLSNDEAAYLITHDE